MLQQGETRRGDGAIVPCAAYFLVATFNLAFASWCSSSARVRPEFALYVTYGASVVWLISAWGSWRAATGHGADVYWLFVLAVWLFNGGGLAISQLFSPNVHDAFGSFYGTVFRAFTLADVIRAYLLVLFCLSAMHAGALIAVSRWSMQRRDSKQVPAAQPDVALGWIGLCLLAVSLGPALWMLWISAQRVWAGGYMALYQESSVTEGLVFMLASGLVPGAFYWTGSNLENATRRRFAGALIVFFSVGVLTLGTRAMFFENIVALLWLCHYGVRPIRKATWAGLVVVGLTLSGLVFWSREAPSRIDLTAANAVGPEEEAKLDPRAALTEMGSSIMTVVYTLDLVPSVRGFAWGETYLASLASIVPRAVDGRETEESWLTSMVTPETAAIGGGLGFSFIAEAYLNFGLGAPLALGFAGALLGWFAGWSHAGGRSGRLALAACVISITLFGARASSLSFVRRIVMLGVAPYVAAAVLTQVARRHEGRFGMVAQAG